MVSILCPGKVDSIPLRTSAFHSEAATRNMDRKELLQKLEQLKKECARKEKKLEKTRKVALRRAHIKKKVQELNSQNKEKSQTSAEPSVSPSSMAVMTVPCDIAENRKVYTGAGNVSGPHSTHSSKELGPEPALQGQKTRKGLVQEILDSSNNEQINLVTDPPTQNFVVVESTQPVHNTCQDSSLSKKVKSSTADAGKQNQSSSPKDEQESGVETEKMEDSVRGKGRVETFVNERVSKTDNVLGVFIRSPVKQHDSRSNQASLEEDSLAVTPSFRTSVCASLTQNEVEFNLEEFSCTLNLYSTQLAKNKFTEGSDSDTSTFSGIKPLQSGAGESKIPLKKNTFFTADAQTHTVSSNVLSEDSGDSHDSSSVPILQNMSMEQENIDDTNTVRKTVPKSSDASNNAVVHIELTPDYKQEKQSEQLFALTEESQDASVEKVHVTSKDNFAAELTPNIEEVSVGCSRSSREQCQRKCDSEFELKMPETKAISESKQDVQPNLQQFSEYTELDVIPFSQFELTEDFLSEASLSQRSSQGGSRRRHSTALVQRRSPRLSAMDFGVCDKFQASSQGVLGGYSHSAVTCSSGQTSLLRLVRKQRKTKKALFLSSLFQFLIDQARRDKTFIEFQLPSDICQLVQEQRAGTATLEHTSHQTESSKMLSKQDWGLQPGMEVAPFAQKDRVSTIPSEAEMSSHPCADSKTENGSFALTDSERIDLIPETELIPELDSQSSQNRESDVVVLKHNTEDICSCTDGKIQQEVLVPVNNDPRHLSVEKGKNDSNFTPVPERSISSGSKCQLKLDNTRQDTFDIGNSSTLSGRLEIHDDIHTKDRSPDSVKTLPPSPRTPGQAIKLDVADSPSLFNTQPEKAEESKLAEKFTYQNRSSSAENQVCHPDSTGDRTVKGTDGRSRSKLAAVFTPSKEKVSEGHAKSDSIIYSGCAQSGCQEPVVAVVSGVSSDGSHTPYILSVQSTVLTLWTQDENLAWTAELNWYLPQESRAENACSIPSRHNQLVALVWGSTMGISAPFLTVFTFQWTTQHIQRFPVPLPSPVLPQRLFCHGLPADSCTILAFATDKAYTRGKTYSLDTMQGLVSAERNMEMVRARLVDLGLVEDLPDAALGLTEDQKIVVWNVVQGALLTTITLPTSLTPLSRVFSSCFYKGYLLQYVQPSSCSYGPCLAAVNPTNSKASIMRQFETAQKEHAEYKQVWVCNGILLALNQLGQLHIWDASSAHHLATVSSYSGNVNCASVLSNNQMCWLITGLRRGCLHIYLVAQAV